MEASRKPDRKKIAHAFDEAKRLVWEDADDYTLGYNNGIDEGKDIALNLLKAQEAVVPIPPDGDENDLYRCGNCNFQLFRAAHENYCPNCGRPLKWNLDRMKVIKGLECCSDGCSQDCPYFEAGDCNNLLAKYALDLIKEQTERIETLESLRRIEREGR